MNIGKLVGHTSLGMFVIIIGIVLFVFVSWLAGSIIWPTKVAAAQMIEGFLACAALGMVLALAHALGGTLVDKFRASGLWCKWRGCHTMATREDFDALGDVLISYCTICDAELSVEHLAETRPYTAGVTTPPPQYK